MNKRVQKKLDKRYGKFHYSSAKFIDSMLKSICSKSWTFDLQEKNKKYEDIIESFKSSYKEFLPNVDLDNIIYEDGIIKGFMHVDLAKMPDFTNNFPVVFKGYIEL